MNEEKFLTEIAEWLSSGCCEPDLWEINGANCRMCKQFNNCSEGKYMIENPK